MEDSWETWETHAALFGLVAQQGKVEGSVRPLDALNFLGLAAQRYLIDPIKQQRLGDCEHRPRPRRRRRRSPGRDRLSQTVAAYLEEVGGRPEAMRQME